MPAGALRPSLGGWSSALAVAFACVFVIAFLEGSAFARAPDEEANAPSAQRTRQVGDVDPSQGSLSLEAGRCLRLRDVMDRLRAWRGDTPIDERLHFVIVERGSSIAIVVHRDGEKVGARDFDVRGRPCDEVNKMVSLSVAIMIDQALLNAPPRVVEEENPPADPEGDSQTVPPPVTPETPSAAPRTSSSPDGKRPKKKQRPNLAPPVRRRTTALVVRGPSSTLLLGPLPAHAFGIGGSVALRLAERYEAHLSASAWRSAPVPFGPASLSATLALAELDVCARRPLWRGAFPGSGAACAGLALGSLHADARGLPDTHASSLPYTATTLSLEVLVELDPRTPPGRVAFFVSSALWIPLISPAFELESRSDPSGSLQWQSDAVGFSVRAGPEFRF